MLPKLALPINIFLFLTLFFSVFIYFFHRAGWYELAQLYKTELNFSESLRQKSKPCICRISKDKTGSFSGIVIAFMKTGIYLNPSAILNLFVPSLLIPWQDISKYEIVKDKEHQFYLGNPMITILNLGTETVRELESLSGIKVSDYLHRE